MQIIARYLVTDDDDRIHQVFLGPTSREERVGVAMLTYWDVHDQIERGELKRIVLTDVKPLEVGIWAVFPTRTHMRARVRAFIDALRDRLLATPPDAQ